MVASDIQQRINVDFGTFAARQIEPIIEEFIELFQGIYGTPPPDRVIRCIVHLAKENQEILQHNLEVALRDWRDVIYWAEYNQKDKKIHDFNKPFEEGI